MKITLTGSLGNIGKPLATELVKKGHSVTVITSNPEKQNEIEAMGAVAAVGSLNDVDFVTKSFTGADIVYCMVPPANYFNPYLDLLDYFQKIGTNFAQAINESGVKKVINLSSIGAHLESGNGILLGTNYVEKSLNELPGDVAIVHIRPTEIFNNLLPQIYSAKNNGFIASNVRSTVVNSWVSPIDIADVVVQEITTPFTGRKVRYVASEELNSTELITILGKAIGNPDLKWLSVTDEQMQSGLETIGMKPDIAKGMTEMYAAIDSGLLYEDYNLNKPTPMGKVKAIDFAKEFAAAYNKL